MLSNIPSWQSLSVVIVYIFLLIKPITNQGLACYKCMTTNPNDDGCRDPFSSLINPVQINCQVYSVMMLFVSELRRKKKEFLLVDFSVKSNYFLSDLFFPSSTNYFFFE